MSEEETHFVPGRPVPDLPTISDSTTANSMQLDLESDHNSGGRRHVPASMSKTSFTANTPASQKRAIRRLKQSLTFSDHSSASSASSTPHKANRSVPSGQGSTHSLQGSTHSAPPTITVKPDVSTRSPRVTRREEGSEYVSEGEAPSGIKISAILSKLEQVKSYLQEAEALHMQMKERLSEPGMTAQVNKMGKLVEDLRKQESGYLGILYKLMDEREHMSQSQLEGGETEEVSEDGGSEGEMPSDTEGEGGEANDSMSLKAELLKEKMVAYCAEQEKQEEQLQVLRQQRDLLRKLLDQQRQIEALESRQKSLLEQNSDVGDELTNQTAQVQQPSAVVNPEMQVEMTRDVPEEEEDDESAAGVASRLHQLREKQARIEQLTQLLSQLKTQTAEEERSSTLPNNGAGAVQMTRNTERPRGPSDSRGELVAVGDQALPVELRELQQKLKQAEEARAKLSDLQNMLSLLQETEGGAGPVRGTPLPATAGRQASERECHQRQQDEDKGQEQVESEDELEQSALSEYEERLERRRREVRGLQEQRDKLLTTQRKLQELQLSMTSNATEPTEPTVRQSDEAMGSNGAGGPVLSSLQLASELGRQRKLYDDLLNKTEQIQSMVDEVAGTRDETGATWGGSSVPSSEEGEEGEEDASTSSQPPVLPWDNTQDTLEHTYTATLGDSAAEAVEVPGCGGGGGGGGGGRGEGEGMVFRVTRHTPRQVPEGVRGGHRRVLTPEQSLLSAGKRMKLDDTPHMGGTRPTPQAGANISGYSAVWPGMIFPTATRKHTRDGATQTGELGPAAHVPAQQPLVDEHLSLLHHQLGMTSSMASQLLYSQQGLITTVCHQLESLQLEDRIQDHFARLHQYQTELEQYYTELQEQNPYAKPAGHPQEDQLQEEEEEEEEEEVDREEPIFRPRTMPDPPPFTSSAVPSSGPTAMSSTTGLGVPVPVTSDPGVTAAGPASTAGDSTQHVSTGHAQAPMAYFPQMYQPQSLSEHQQQMQEEVDRGNVNEQNFTPAPPPPPIPPYFQLPSPYPPYRHSPWITPSPYPTAPPSHHMANGFEHSFSLHPSSAFMPPPPPHPSYPSPYTRLRLSWPAPHLPGVPPVYPGYYGSTYNPVLAGGCGLNSSQAFGYMPGAGEWTSPVPRREGGEGGGQRSYSPSGVTGVSMQVQPPTSPPSAPSVSNLQHTSSLPHTNTGSGPLPQSFSSTLRPHATSTTGPTKTSSVPTLPNLTPHIPTSSTVPPPLPTHTTTAAGMQQKSEEGVRRKMAGGHGAVEGEGQAGNSCMDEESLSSMPLSLPDTSRSDAVGGATTGDVVKPPEDFSVFDALRDTIYSEVATLIANNENRPHFLVELFRELQMLSSDYLRQRALYSLQDLVTRYLTEESLQQQRKREDSAPGLHTLQEWVGSEATPSESLVTSEDELAKAKPPSKGERGGVEGGQSGSWTPTRTDEAPFAADNIGDTVVRLDKAMAKLRESCVSGASPGTMQPPVVSPGPPPPSNSSQSETIQYPPDVNTEQLDKQIKTVVTEVIPLLKEHMMSPCSAELLQQIKQLVIGLILDQLKEQDTGMVETFSRQLDKSLQSALLKYLNKMLRECGEALLVEVSEVLFNELAFFRVMQTMGVQNDSNIRSMSQNGTENGRGKEVIGEREVDKEVKEEVESAGTLPILQALSADVAKTLSDEQEALGKTRDDELAREWNAPQDKSSSPSLLDEQTVVVELSASESKPVQSAGSGEEDVEEGEEQATIAPDPQTEEKTQNTTEVREETPPTPVIAAIPVVTTTTGRDGTTGEDSVMSAQSPPLHLSNAALEVQMKVEQQSTEGIAGILVTIEQQQELAGEGDQLPQPGPSKALAEP